MQQIRTVVLQHLSLLQVLCMLPLDVLRNSFASHLSLRDLGTVRLVCKEACQLVCDFTACLTVQFAHDTPLQQLAKSVKKFTSLNEVELCFNRPHKSADYSASFLFKLLHKCSAQFQQVTSLTLFGIPLTYATSTAVQTRFPKLQVLTLGGKCCVETRDAVFQPFVSLVSLNFIGDVRLSQWYNSEAADSLLTLSNLAHIAMLSDYCGRYFFNKPEMLSNIRHVCIRYAGDTPMNSLIQLPCLEVLEIHGHIEYSFAIKGRLTALKQVILRNERKRLDVLSDLLSQPVLKAVTWETPESLVIPVASDPDVIPAQEWLETACATLKLLQRFCGARCLHRLTLRSGANVDQEQVLTFVKALPTIPDCAIITMAIPVNVEILRCLATKLPNVTHMEWFDCAEATDALLKVVPEFPNLQRFEIISDTKVSAIGAMALALQLGQRAVQIYMSELLRGTEADFEWVNSVLSASGARSTLYG